MKVHPLADRLPMIEGDEWEAFKASIKETKGIEAHPILYRVVSGEMELLDGRNRLKACRELRIKPKMKKVAVKDEDCESFIKLQNDRRRHMTKEQRAAFIFAMREAGESIRTIADEAKVDEKTVRNTLNDPGAEYSAPAEVKGSDGKTYKTEDARCARCRRMFPNSRTSVPDCPNCKENKAAKAKRRQPGDESRPKSEPKRSGQLLCDWKSFNASFGALAREIDKFGNLHKCKESVAARDLRKHLADFKKSFVQWFENITKTKAPK